MRRQYDHGTRARYVWQQCRCEPCSQANREYARKRYRIAMGYEEGPSIDAGPSRDRINKLLKEGYSLRTLAKAMGVSESGLAKLVRGFRGRPPSRRIMRATARKIERFEIGDVIEAEYGFVPAAPIWRLVNGLLDAGMTKGAIAQAMGSNTPSLQIGHVRVGWRTAKAVMDLYSEVVGGNPHDLEQHHARGRTLSSRVRMDDLLFDTLWGEWLDIKRIISEYQHTFGGSEPTIKRALERWLDENQGRYKIRYEQINNGMSRRLIYVESPY